MSGQGWTGKDFKAWRERVGYSLTQTAHVLDVTRRTVQRLQADDTEIDANMHHVCESVELIKQLQVPGLFYGNAKDIILQHHAPLIQRMQDAENMRSSDN